MFGTLLLQEKWGLPALAGSFTEHYQDGTAPRIYLEGTHISVIEFVDLETLREFSVDA